MVGGGGSGGGISIAPVPGHTLANSPAHAYTFMLNMQEHIPPGVVVDVSGLFGVSEVEMEVKQCFNESSGIQKVMPSYISIIIGQCH